MTYSLIYNIKATNLENYNFTFKKNVKIRFLTFNNQLGIDLGIENEEYINNTSTNENLWYHSSKINDFSALNSLSYLILQIFSDQEISDNILIKNNSFQITNKNNSYNCFNLGPTCGIKIYNFQIHSHKPLQQINKKLKYTIIGDAKLVDLNYIKSGTKDDSKIKVTTFYPYEINYINNFLLKKINQSKKIKKENIYSEIKIPNLNISKNSEINNLNYIIEHLKFQLKNYFVENNKNLHEIDSKFLDIYQNINFISDNNLSIKNLENQIKNINSKLELKQENFDDKKYLTNKIESFENVINSKIDENKEIFNKNIKNVYNQIKNFNNNEISDIKKNIDILNQKTNKLENNNFIDEKSLLIDSLSNKLNFYIQQYENMNKKINDIKKNNIESNNDNDIQIKILSKKLDNYINK